MSCCSVSTVCPSLECAPCPPFFVVDVYQILVNVSLSLNLTEDEYKAIARRCNIQEPTTTTSTTTTTTTTKSTTTTTVRTTTTTINNIPTSEKIDTTSRSHSPNITDSDRTTVPITNSTMFTTPSKPEFNLTSTSGSTPPRTTQMSTGSSRRQHRWPYCNDVCLIIVITSSVCVFLVVLVLLSLCCRRKRTHDKTDGRRTSSQRLVANGTYDRTASFERIGRIGSVSDGVWRHNPGIENLAYRKSMELREPLKYMEYEQNWEDLDYYGSGSNKNIKDGSLRSDKISQRNDNSPRRKRRPNKDKTRNSMEGLNGRPGLVFIPLDDRKPRSLPRIPLEPQSYSDKQEFGYRSSSLPRTAPKHQHPVEHRRSKSDGNNKPRSKQRPKSFDQLYFPPHNIDKGDKAVNGALKRIQKSNLNSEPNHIKNTFPTKDDNLKRAQDRKPSNTSHKTSKPKTDNGNQKSNRGPDRSLERFNRSNDNIFPALHGSSSPKFYPPYRDSNNQNVLFTTRL